MSLPQDNIFYQRDTLELEFQLYKNKSTNEYWDLTDYKIRFQLIDGSIIIKKATANVSGGSSDEINITNPTLGKFIVFITTLETTSLSPDDYTYQIQIESPDGKKYTVLQDSIRILDALIDWDVKVSGE